MKENKDQKTRIQNQQALDDLRRRAEKVLQENPLETDGLSSLDFQFIVHELQVHQVELQLQNEELRRYQQELEISRDNFSGLYNFAPVCYCTLDHKGIIQEANQMCSTIFGVENKKLIGQPLSQFVHPDDQDLFYLHHRHTLKNQEKQVDEMRVIGTDASIRSVQIQSIAGGDQEDQIRVVLSDITDRKYIEQKLKEREASLAQHLDQLNALFEATGSLQSTLDTDTLLQRILQSILKAIPAAKMGLLYLIPTAGEMLHVSAFAFSLGAKQERMAFSGRNKYVSKVIATKRHLLLPEIKVLSRNDSAGALKVKKTRSALIVPLITERQIYGAISLESPEKGAFTAAELNLLESFAATATAALRNARMHEQLQAVAGTDFLTNVYNRQGFFEISEIEFQRFLRYARPLSIITLDIDEFKMVNDSYGHAAGDLVLVQLAERIKGMLRKSDILCRYGGDEFVILLPETDLDKAVKTAKRLNQRVKEPAMQIGDQTLQITISQGVCQASKEMKGFHHLLDKADAALYQAKAAGRNRIDLVG